MEKKQIVDRVAAIIKRTYIELNELSKQVEKEQLNEEKMMNKLNRTADDVAALKKALIG